MGIRQYVLRDGCLQAATGCFQIIPSMASAAANQQGVPCRGTERLPLVTVSPYFKLRNLTREPTGSIIARTDPVAAWLGSVRMGVRITNGRHRSAYRDAIALEVMYQLHASRGEG